MTSETLEISCVAKDICFSLRYKRYSVQMCPLGHTLTPFVIFVLGINNIMHATRFGKHEKKNA